jgi:hypothetical protein
MRAKAEGGSMNFVLGQSTGKGEGGGGDILVPLLGLAILFLLIASIWKVFTKAGKPGWAVIVPIYNIIVVLEIAGCPLWWILLYFIPIVNWVIVILVALRLAGAFGRGALFGLGLAFLPFIFYPILGFGDSRYMGRSSR